MPAVGPGDPVAHARQRGILGRVASLRLGLTDLGVALTSIGLVLAVSPAVVVGAGAMVAGFGATAALLGAAIVVGLRRRRPPA